MALTLSGRLSAKQTGWLVVLLIIGWFLFLVLPFGKTEREEPVKVAELRPGEAELTAAGLSYNVDWIGLPKFFPIWADQLVWRGDTVEFGYWNPNTEAYTYFFEATRKGKAYRFRALGKNEIPYADFADNVVDKEKAAEMHPFQQIYFGTAQAAPIAPALPKNDGPGDQVPETSRPEIKLEPARLEPPKPEFPEETTSGKKK